MSRSTEFFRRLSRPSRLGLLMTAVLGLCIPHEVEGDMMKEQVVDTTRNQLSRGKRTPTDLEDIENWGLTYEEKQRIKMEECLEDVISRLESTTNPDFESAADEIMTYVDLVSFDDFDYLFLNPKLFQAVPYEPLHLELLAFYLHGLEVRRIEDEMGSHFSNQERVIGNLSLLYDDAATENVRFAIKQAIEHYLGDPKFIFLFPSFLKNPNHNPEFQNILLERVLLKHLFLFSDPDQFGRLLSAEGQLIVLRRYQKWLDDLLSESPSDFSLSMIENYWTKGAIEHMREQAKRDDVSRELREIEKRLAAVEKMAQKHSPDQKAKQSGESEEKCKPKKITSILTP